MKWVSKQIVNILALCATVIGFSCLGQGMYLSSITNESDAGFYFVSTSTPLDKIEDAIKRGALSLERDIRPFAIEGRPEQVPAMFTNELWTNLITAGGPLIQYKTGWVKDAITTSNKVPFCLDRNTRISYLQSGNLGMAYEANLPGTRKEEMNYQTIILVPITDLPSCQPWIFIGRSPQMYYAKTYLVNKTAQDVPCCVTGSGKCTTDSPYRIEACTSDKTMPCVYANVGTELFGKKHEGEISLTITKEKRLNGLGVASAIKVTPGWKQPVWLRNFASEFGLDNRLDGWEKSGTSACKMGFSCKVWKDEIKRSLQKAGMTASKVTGSRYRTHKKGKHHCKLYDHDTKIQHAKNTCQGLGYNHGVLRFVSPTSRHLDDATIGNEVRW